MRDSDEECRATAEAILRTALPFADLEAAIGMVVAEADDRPPGWSPAHRALADALDERSHWLAVGSAAARMAAEASDAERE